VLGTPVITCTKVVILSEVAAGEFSDRFGVRAVTESNNLSAIPKSEEGFFDYASRRKS